MDTAATLSNIAFILMLMDRLEESLIYHSESLRIIMNLQGHKEDINAETVASMEDISHTLL